MKVSELITYLNGLDPNEHIAVLWWERNLFTVSEDDKLPAPEAWAEAVQELESWDDAGNGIWEFLQETVMDKQFQLEEDSR